MVRMTDALPAWLAVVLHAVVYVTASNVSWLLRLPQPGRRGRWLERTRALGSRLHLGEALRLAFYLGVPYLLLVDGWLSPLDVGLADLDWISGVGWTAALAGASSALLLALWWPYRRLQQTTGTPDAHRLAQPWGWAFVLRDVLYLEAWWAFWRTPFVWWLGAYRGVYVGMGAVLLALLLNRRAWRELGTPGLREQLALGLSMACLSTTVYVYTRNFWLCVSTHLVVRVLITRWANPVVEHFVEDERPASQKGTQPRAI